MKYFLHTLFFFLLVTQICFAQWYRQDNFPQTNSLSSVKFIDVNNGWAVGGNGTVLHTTNGGLEWLSQAVETNNLLKCVSFVDQNNGWIVGRGGVLLKTTNSGLNWISKNSITEYSFNAVHFENINYGWAVGDGLILRTTNGGEDWLQANFTWYLLNSVYFINSQHGWVAGVFGQYFTTTDGGISWSPLPYFTYNDLHSVCFGSEDIGWLASAGQDLSNGHIYKLTDGGFGWEYIFHPDCKGLLSIDFISHLGCAVGAGGTILRTYTSGASWQIKNSWTSNNLNSVDFVNVYYGWAVGDYGTIIKSTDGGESWINLTKETVRNLKSVFFIDANNGWAVGEDGSNYVGKILRTHNGGNEWLSSVVNMNGSLNSVYFLNPNLGWAVGDSGNIFYTTNHGFTWLSSTVDSSDQSLSSVHFSDMQNGWAVGGNTIFKSIDGGINWLRQVNDTLGWLNSVYFTSPTTGYMTGGKSCGWYCWMATIYRTTDAGINWISQLQDTIHSSLSSIYFIDQNNGWASGNNLILHTSNGGLNWVKQSSDTLADQLNTIHFTDVNNGYAVGTAILRTTNGGANWIKQVSGTEKYLSGVFFIDPLNGWAVGENGIILHTTNGGVSFVEEEQIDEIPTEFLLSQNYPNPFNPITKISWQSPVGSHQTIKVFDVLGNEIATLVNEYKPAGRYEVEFNATSLPSGVYFYRIQAGSFVETKKMVLMK